jgi:hypothetical protein
MQIELIHIMFFFSRKKRGLDKHLYDNIVGIEKSYFYY